MVLRKTQRVSSDLEGFQVYNSEDVNCGQEFAALTGHNTLQSPPYKSFIVVLILYSEGAIIPKVSNG